MRRQAPLFSILLAVSCSGNAPSGDREPTGLRIVTLDPGHFHAALFQEERLPGVSPTAWVYAPLGTDLAAHLERVARFNARQEAPTDWALRVYAGDDFLERMVEERPGDILILSGRNRRKADAILAGVSSGLHVLADKPWIVEAEDLPRIEEVLAAAGSRGLAVLDGMTQRFEISCLLVREIVGSPEVFGEAVAGSAREPGARLSSLHHILKRVAGAPNRRPSWFFDVREQGEGLADVGTHLVDLAHWTLFPDAALDRERDIRVVDGAHWPTWVTLEDFRRVTGEAEFPASLAPSIVGSRLRYLSNNSVDYIAKGIRVRIEVRWETEAGPGGGDEERHAYRGSLSRVELRQGRDEGFVPEVFVTPNEPGDRARILDSLRRVLRSREGTWPGLAVEETEAGFRVRIPAELRAGHEAHFALLARRFLEYVRDPRSVPSWEGPNTIVKYHITTRGVELARARERSEGKEESP